MENASIDWLVQDKAKQICLNHKIHFHVTLYRNNKAVMINEIIVPASLRMQGIGTEALIEFLCFCDRNMLYATLTPDNTWGSDIERLTAWYKRLGFKSTDKLFEPDAFLSSLDGLLYYTPKITL